MTTIATVSTDTQVARPLRVLVPLIKQELVAGESAGLPHYRKVGEYLNEAKDQIVPDPAKATRAQEGEWREWLSVNFHMSNSTARRYMDLAEQNGKHRPAVFTARTLSEATGDLRRTHDPIGTAVRSIVAKVDVERLARERQTREQEALEIKRLGLKLIAIGYRVLAGQLHPDHRGGSAQAMKRLNEVRRRLTEAL